MNRLLKQQKLYNTNNQANNPPPGLPLINITNFLNAASSLLPQTSTSTSTSNSSETSGAKRGSKPFPHGPLTGQIIRPVDQKN